jgi:hypothetical protein
MVERRRIIGVRLATDACPRPDRTVDILTV